MGCIYIDMTGQRFGRLVCIRLGKSCNSGRYWICLCDCGKETEVLRGNLINGNTTSCGCFWNEVRKANGHKRIKHGYATKRTKTYITWEAMHSRCNNPNADWYHRYGGRGKKICEKWNNFLNFLFDMGERPEGKTLDRKNPDGNYEPNNCRWATPLEQSNNKSIL
jgi:hypothetical protein